MAQRLRFDPNVNAALSCSASDGGPTPASLRATAVASILLWLGTAPFPLTAAALGLAPPELLGVSGRGAVLSCLVSYGAMILAYIGGIQQATALHADNRTQGRAWVLVVAGIVVRYD